MTAIAFTCMPAAAVAARPVASRAARAAVATPAAAAFSARRGTAGRRCAASAAMLSVSLLHQPASSGGMSAAADQPLPAPCSQAAGAAAWRRPCGVRQLGCTRGVCCRQGNPCWPGAVAAGPGAAPAPVPLRAAQPCSARCSRRLRLLPANLPCCPAPLGRSWRTSARRRAPCSGSRCRLAAQPPPTQRQAWEGVQGGGGESLVPAGGAHPTAREHTGCTVPAKRGTVGSTQLLAPSHTLWVCPHRPASSSRPKPARTASPASLPSHPLPVPTRRTARWSC